MLPSTISQSFQLCSLPLIDNKSLLFSFKIISSCPVLSRQELMFKTHEQYLFRYLRMAILSIPFFSPWYSISNLNSFSLLSHGLFLKHSTSWTTSLESGFRFSLSQFIIITFSEHLLSTYMCMWSVLDFIESRKAKVALELRCLGLQIVLF